MPLTWLVTGCSSGFGTAFVRAIIARGDNCIATGRDIVSKLAHLEKSGAALLELDVTSPQPVIDHQIDKALQLYGRIDVLVNNAGYMMGGFVEELTPETLQTQFQTNLYGSLAVTKAVVKHMRVERSGTLVFMSSRAGWRANRSLGAYAASKFALEGMVEALGQEVASFNIRTLLFCPGVFATNALSTSYKYTKTAIPDYQEIDTQTHAYVTGLCGKEPGDPKTAVKVILDLVKREGSAKDRDVPFRMPLGSDCLQIMRAKCGETLKVCDEWEDVIRSTDHRVEI